MHEIFMNADTRDAPVVYTVIIGDGYRLPLVRNVQDVPHSCFTNRRLDPKGREIRQVAQVLPADPVRRSRDPKVRPLRFLPDHARFICIDPTVDLEMPASALWQALMPSPPARSGLHVAQRPPGVPR